MNDLVHTESDRYSKLDAASTIKHLNINENLGWTLVEIY